jgi:hypothetical protein
MNESMRLEGCDGVGKVAVATALLGSPVHRWEGTFDHRMVPTPRI